MVNPESLFVLIHMNYINNHRKNGKQFKEPVGI